MEKAVDQNVDISLLLDKEFESEPAEFAEENLEEIDDDLMCSICLDLLFNPLCTPCGHTF